MITRGEQMLALRKARMAAAHPFLRGGFRPFFYGAAAWALLALVLWLCSLAGAFTLPTASDPLAWHRHEMLFGFVGAAIAGFLLTAIPNWTGRLPIAGTPLLTLFALWLAGRLAVLFSAIVGASTAAILDVGFFVVLAAICGREVLASRNRNIPVVGLVLLFAAANGADHLEAGGFMGGELGWRAAIALIVLMISLIGGRIIPSFTRNWMMKQGIAGELPTQPGRFDMLVIAGTAAALLFWLTFPDDGQTGLLLVAASALQGLRLAMWRGSRSAADPLVFILHVGYAWVPAGLLLLGLSLSGADIPRTAAIHALTAGAMATMILAVMTRASLGHTGRDLKANAATVAVYVLVTIGALLRVVAARGYVAYTLAIHVSALAWGGAFLLFLIAYAPVLWRPRLGGATEGRVAKVNS